MNTLQDTIEVLRQARGLVQGGWVRGQYNSWDGYKVHYCAVGGIRQARALRNQSYGAVDDPAQQALAYTVYGNPVDWNDNPTRKKREVLDAFDVTIERLERIRGK